jgi:hypothetical protein
MPVCTKYENEVFRSTWRSLPSKWDFVPCFQYSTVRRGSCQEGCQLGADERRGEYIKEESNKLVLLLPGAAINQTSSLGSHGSGKKEKNMGLLQNHRAAYCLALTIHCRFWRPKKWFHE